MSNRLDHSGELLTIGKLIKKYSWMNDSKIAKLTGTSRFIVGRERVRLLGSPIGKEQHGGKYSDEMIFTKEEIERLDRWLIERGLMKSESSKADQGNCEGVD